ncbi:MAG: type VI secretion system baseplate subunit TssK [Planctomycetota bacterium]
MPELMARSPNTFEEGETGDAVRRYQVRLRNEVDENTGEGERPIGYRQLSGRLIVGNEDRSGYKCLPIAKIVLSGEVESVVQVVPNYVPPVRRLGADLRLVRQLEDVVNALQAKARSIGEQVTERKIYWGGEGGGGDAEMLWKLHVLNGSIATLRPLVRSPELHPFRAYLEFCRLVGDLAIFSRERIVPELPPYEHLDLEGCYTSIVREAKRLLDAIIPTSFVRRAFDRAEIGRQVTLEEEWTAPGTTIVLGVETDVDEAEVRKKMGTIKLSAPTELNTIQTQRLTGIPKSEITRVPAELPDRDNIHYWQIECDGDHWYRAREERALSLFGPASENNAYEFSLYVIFGKGGGR